MRDNVSSGTRRTLSLLGLLLFLYLLPLTCRAADDSDPEDYKFKFDAHWWIARPSGSLQGDTGPIDFQKDFNFGNYNTFYGLLTWKPRRKHHIFCYIAPNRSSSDHVLSRQIEFHGQTFFANEKVHAGLQSFLFSPGYEYDIFSRPRGHLGIEFQVNLFDWEASINTNGGVVLPDGTVTTARGASKTAFLPLPTGGPSGRYYLVPSRLYVDGQISGMYFFGYGNFIAASGFLGYSNRPSSECARRLSARKPRGNSRIIQPVGSSADPERGRCRLGREVVALTLQSRNDASGGRA